MLFTVAETVATKGWPVNVPLASVTVSVGVAESAALEVFNSLQGEGGRFGTSARSAGEYVLRQQRSNDTSAQTTPFHGTPLRVRVH